MPEEKEQSAEAKADDGSGKKTFVERFWLPIVLAVVPVAGTVIVAIVSKDPQETRTADPVSKNSPTLTTATSPTSTGPTRCHDLKAERPDATAYRETPYATVLAQDANVRQSPYAGGMQCTLLRNTRVRVAGTVSDGYLDAAADRKKWHLIKFQDPDVADEEIEGGVSSVVLTVP